MGLPFSHEAGEFIGCYQPICHQLCAATSAERQLQHSGNCLVRPTATI
jgi:hypothetical protein